MSNINSLINNFSTINLIAFLRTSIPSFKPYEEDLDHLFTDDIYHKYEAIIKIGEAKIDNDELIVIASKTNEPLTERTGKKNQYQIAKTILKHELKDASLFIFYDDKGNFRFSFVKANYLGTKRDFTDFKRYTYFVTPSQTNKTFIKQVGGCNFNSLDEIIQAFSVEPLNKQFYQDIAKSFYGLIGGKVKIGSRNVEFDTSLKLPSTPVDTNRKVYQEFAVRLIGRTIFCWFLKSKKSENSIPLVPESWLSSKTVVEANNQQHNYYHSVLEKLFFLVLNKKQKDRKDYELPNDHELIPFLNGGLFEAQTDDFFPTNGKGIHQISFDLKIPNQWFIELFEVLEQYNFTIDENSIYDAEVSIDPEMLGTIFENLLAEIDPDTEKSARKATGSFYTPREIVDYMVEQSLVQYLKTKVDTENEEQLLELFKEGGENKFEQKQTTTILEALSDVKILDPACGSGAFPMGALHKIIIALQKLDPDASWWKQKQIENVPNALAKQMLKEKLDGESADYVRKLGVIQNSIYGVDIQPIASEISKLRSFLSLVIDETIIDDAENRGIQALPNLEFKFVTANTLIGLEEKQRVQGAFDFGQTDELQDQLKTIRNQYLQAYGEEKSQLKKDFDVIQTKILKQEIAGGGQNKRALQLASWKPFSNESNTWFDPYWMYGVEKFDIVIGNPPYIFSRENLNHSKKSLYKSLFSLTQFKLNLYILFIEKAYSLIDINGTLNYIIPNNWLTVPTNSDLRKFILTETKDINIVQNYSNVFQQASVDTLLLSFCKNGKNALSYFEWENGTPIKRLSNNPDVYLKNKGHIISVSSNINQELTFLLNLEGEELKDLCEVRNGVQAYTVGEGKPVCTEEMKNNRVYHDMKKNGPNWIKYLDGSDIGRYKYNWTGMYIKYGDNLARKRKSYLFEGDRILVRQIPSKLPYAINATIVDENAVNDNNLMIIKINDEKLKIGYLLGLLNSKLISFWFAIKFDKLSRKIFPQFKINELRIFPIIIPDDSIQENINSLVNVVLENNIKNHDTEKEENLIDTIVYLLYNLKYKQVKTIDPEFNLTQEEYNNYQLN